MTWVWGASATAGNERLVLLAIADTADDDGGNAWPSVATLARKTRLDARTVQRVIRRLAAGGHLLIETAAGRGGANMYTVVMSDTAEPKPGPVDNRPSGRPDPRQAAGGGNPPPPAQLRHRPPGTVVSPLPRHSCATRTSLNVLEPPPPARAASPADSPGAVDGGGGSPKDRTTPSAARVCDRAAGEHPAKADAAGLLAGLGSSWRLTSKQRARLAPLVTAALTAGWGPAELREVLGANPGGVRSPYAVLRARLADLPAPPTVRTTPAVERPAWCGACDETTRLVDLDDGRASRCPTCHPLIAVSEGRRVP
ncbi:helix-turn-helix domain-containing protein [Frankia sp. Cas3]|uniref:helix-turn-helix domain-containing protein n=1 Tax=Frankia sp. Cas3 TaxID=3073926 RepID=UPI002AD41D5D|nr:helix-turn-helix domain-containing protein [Frankia sp. Cas3]